MQRLVPRGGGVVMADGATAATGMGICWDVGCVGARAHATHSPVPRDTSLICATKPWA